MRQYLADHKRILDAVVRHSDNDPGRVVFIVPPQPLQILTLIVNTRFSLCVQHSFAFARCQIRLLSSISSGFFDLATTYRRHAITVPAIVRKAAPHQDTVKSCQIRSWSRHQRSQVERVFAQIEETTTECQTLIDWLSCIARSPDVAHQQKAAVSLALDYIDAVAGVSGDSYLSAGVMIK